MISMGIVDLITLFFVGNISLALAGVSFLLITGRGFLFQSGTERLSKTPDNEYAAFQKEFIGKSILIVAFATPLLAFAVIYDMPWLCLVYDAVLLIVGLVDAIFMSIKNIKRKKK